MKIASRSNRICRAVIFKFAFVIRGDLEVFQGIVEMKRMRNELMNGLLVCISKAIDALDLKSYTGILCKY